MNILVQCPPQKCVNGGNLPPSKDCVSGAVAIRVEYHYRPRHYVWWSRIHWKVNSYEQKYIEQNIYCLLKDDTTTYIQREFISLQNTHICRNDEHYY